MIPCDSVAKFSTGHREARGSVLRRVLIFSLSQFSVCLLASDLSVFFFFFCLWVMRRAGKAVECMTLRTKRVVSG